MLEGRIALVTGASSGIGLAVARSVVAGGGKVALVARTESNLRQAARELGMERAAVFPLDVTDLARLEELPARVLEPFGARYLSPRLMGALRPALERRGERNKRALIERRAAHKQ
jgi:NAD(P)-dependent dehydrogenase (short-subunit alcohol dehydrogenase family)